MQLGSQELTSSAGTGRSVFLQGVKAGIPVAIGYIPTAITFGLLAKAAGVPALITVMMSFFIYAGASQFVGVNLLTVGAAFSEIVLTTFILNLRHFLMTASLSQRIRRGTAKKWLALIAYGVTDETFSIASLRPEKQLEPAFVCGLNLIAFTAWNVGTWAGVFLASGLPESLQASMGIALYAMFIGLLVPSIKKARPVLVVSSLAALINSALHWVPWFSGLSAGWGIMIATILAAAAGAVFFPKGVED
ncbi:AzlC family ABC transporter permease [Bacillaceae bacterium]